MRGPSTNHVTLRGVERAVPRLPKTHEMDGLSSHGEGAGVLRGMWMACGKRGPGGGPALPRPAWALTRTNEMEKAAERQHVKPGWHATPAAAVGWGAPGG